MATLQTYQIRALENIRACVDAARTRGRCDIDPAAVPDHPWFSRAIGEIGANCESGDEAALVLSRVADELQEAAEAARGQPGWGDMCAAMGAIREAAAAMFRLDHEARLAKVR
jgi:hypothetical protein